MGDKDSTDISSKYFRYDYILYTDKGFPGGSEVKVSACNAGDLGSIHGSGRSPREGNGNPLQYSCLENLIDGGAWWATVHGVAKRRTRLSDFTSLHILVRFIFPGAKPSKPIQLFTSKRTAV